jgi:UV DNA damage endonuclease
MRIGYPCINNSIGCTASRTFRLRSYSPERLVSTVKENLSCLKLTLEFNDNNNLLFFRIGSGLIPFASHEICKICWQSYFLKELKEIGNFIKKHHMRISMHPDQFVLINAKDSLIVKRSIRELEYHTQVLDLMSLDRTAKIQIHAGGVYNDKNASIKRFVESYRSLDKRIKNRLVIENDDHLYSVNDCMNIHNLTSIPILFDSFHHEIFNNGESLSDALSLCASTWKKSDGPVMVDYSSQSPGSKKGAHATHIDGNHFLSFLNNVNRIDFDLMLEIKDKEKSAGEALKLIKSFSSLIN